jgi:hypothetical protein
MRSGCACRKYVILFFYPLVRTPVASAALTLWASDMLPNVRRCPLIRNCMCLRMQDFTFVCPTEITAFSDAYNGFKELDCEVRLSLRTLLTLQCSRILQSTLQVLGQMPTDWYAAMQVLGVSVDSQFSHLAWIQTGESAAACHTLLIFRP